MTIRWLPRRTATAAKVPTTTDLVDGEIGVNTTDKKIFIRVGAAIVELFKTLTKADVGLDNVDNTSDATKNVLSATKLTTARTVALSGAATGTATSFDGSANIAIPVTGLNASNLNAGTVPDARMSGTYSGISVKVPLAGAIFSSNDGADNRVVSHVVSYRSASSAATGAIVFSFPTGVSTVMCVMRVFGQLYVNDIIDFTVKGYCTTSWSQTKLQHQGTNKPMVRFGKDASGRACLILGDTTTVWSYPHVALQIGMFSHTGADDPVATGWSAALVTDLTAFTVVTAGIADTGLDAMTLGGTAAAAFAPIASPAFTGTPTVPTAALNTNTTQAASTAYVLAAIADDAPTKTGGGASGTWGISITGSAATLTTARTINGTSFNGSANITTANWGTARTITIGSTGKSVNGSANVSWTLAELGAQAALGFTPLDAASNNYTRAPNNGSSLDLDNEITYCYMSSVSTSAHSPAGTDGWYTLVNIRHRGGETDGNSWGSQIALGMTVATDRMFFRRQSSGTWGSWQEVVSSPDQTVNKIVKMTAAAYAALGTKDAATLYVIVG